jgi:hypothetical protein
MMRINVTFVPNEDMVTDAIAVLHAQGKKITLPAVRGVLRDWYTHGGMSVEAEALEERIFPDDIDVDSDDYFVAWFHPVLTDLKRKAAAS